MAEAKERKDRRNILIAIDGSVSGEEVFHCRYIRFNTEVITAKMRFTVGIRAMALTVWHEDSNRFVDIWGQSSSVVCVAFSLCLFLLIFVLLSSFNNINYLISIFKEKF